jgi:hypothetical protein
MRRILLIFLAIIVVALGGYAIWRNQMFQPKPLTPKVGANTSLAYFINQTQQKIISELGQPIEGFEQSMFLRVYPGLILQDFNDVETVGSTNPPGLATSADNAITEKGMDTLLKNISFRSGLPSETNADIDEIIQFLETAPADPSAATSRQITLIGKSTCLPHKNTSGPQTLECAIGIQAIDGSYYSLDLSLIDMQTASKAQAAPRMKVEGHFTPAEALSSNTWHKYNMKGIVKVLTIVPQ